ncbi:MAG: DUF1254 domain-containing protein [Thermodesulfobacteriota bacterium]
MKIKRIHLYLIWLILGHLFSGPMEAGAGPSAEEIYGIGIKAYIYGYPLVLVEMTRQTALQRTPVNRFGHAPAFPPPTARTVIRPNSDTLYSSAWIDLSQEPIILSLPDTKERYYLVQIMDAWTETIAVPGKRTTGTAAGHFILIGPQWKGTLPSGLNKIQAATNTLWIIGRIQTNTSADYPNVHSLQKGFLLTPLSAWGKEPPSLPGDERKLIQTPVHGPPPPAMVAAMDSRTFFSTMARLLKDNPPHPEDGPMTADLRTLGLIPGQPFDPSRLGPEGTQSLERALADARKQILEQANKPPKLINGWRFNSNVGRYGTDYLTRAIVAMGGLGALPLEEAVYLGCSMDREGKPLNGNNRYLLHFEKNTLPPVNAFWSVTLYGRDGFYVPNPLNRYALGDRDPLRYNADGSLDLYIQNPSPGADRESNWLPSPSGPFLLSLRLYWPKAEVINGRWTPPEIRLLD